MIQKSEWIDTRIIGSLEYLATTLIDNFSTTGDCDLKEEITREMENGKEVREKWDFGVIARI